MRLVARANPRVFSVRRVKANSMVMVVSTTLTSSSDNLNTVGFNEAPRHPVVLSFVEIFDAHSSDVPKRTFIYFPVIPKH